MTKEIVLGRQGEKALEEQGEAVGVLDGRLVHVRQIGDSE